VKYRARGPYKGGKFGTFCTVLRLVPLGFREIETLPVSLWEIEELFSTRVKVIRVRIFQVSGHRGPCRNLGSGRAPVLTGVVPD
jgi:hypothetical protein